MRTLYRLLSLAGDAKAASRGPGAYVRRLARKAGHRQFARLLRRAVRP